MAFRRFLGLPTNSPAAAPIEAPAPAAAAAAAETATVRRIVASLEALPPAQARYLAGFAYIMSRAAQADLEISETEAREIERLIVTEHGELTEAQAVLVVEIARVQARLHGETEDYVVTREWRRHATDAQALALLRCCFLVGAVEGGISAYESATLNEIGNELGMDSPTVARVRSEFAGQVAALQALRPPAD